VNCRASEESTVTHYKSDDPRKVRELPVKRQVRRQQRGGCGTDLKAKVGGEA
jgi:hypothetical protein